MRTMKKIMDIPQTAPSSCNPIFSWFFKANFNPELICMQDATHLAVKLHRRVMNKDLVIGNQIASKTHLKTMIANSRKDEHGILESHLSFDKMNYDVVQKVFNSKTQKALSKYVPQSEATVFYLNMISCVAEAYLEENTLPGCRIYLAWYLVFICR